MKKMMTLLLVLAMALSLAACGGDKTPTPTTGNVETTPVQNNTPTDAQQPTDGGKAENDGFVFDYKGTKIAMSGEVAPILEALGEPKSYTEETSCAFTGLDKTYFFGSFYLQTYPIKDKDYVFCLWLADDSVATEEGIRIGSTKAEVEKAYGAESFNGTNAYILTKGSSRLTVILTDGVVSSVQYDALVTQ